MIITWLIDVVKVMLDQMGSFKKTELITSQASKQTNTQTKWYGQRKK